MLPPVEPYTYFRRFELDAGTRRDLAPYLPALGFVLEDLSAHRDQELRARVMSAMPKLVLWALKHGLLDALRDWTHVIHETLEAPNGVASLALVLRYILEVSEIEPGAIEAFLAAELDSDAKEAYMTGPRSYDNKDTRKDTRMPCA